MEIRAMATATRGTETQIRGTAAEMVTVTRAMAMVTVTREMEMVTSFVSRCAHRFPRSSPPDM